MLPEASHYRLSATNTQLVVLCSNCSPYLGRQWMSAERCSLAFTSRHVMGGGDGLGCICYLMESTSKSNENSLPHQISPTD